MAGLKYRVVALLWAVSLALGGCGSTSEECAGSDASCEESLADRLCEPGQPAPCVCGDGSTGSAVCSESGMSLGSCSCAISTETTGPPRPSMAPPVEGPLLPPEGRTLVVVGQDTASIEGYAQSVGVPEGVMVYTSIQELQGLDMAADYGAGENHADGLLAEWPGRAVQVGLYMVGALEDVVAGRYDGNIERLGDWIAAVDAPVYLRIGYEFDGAHNAYEPEAFVRAWRVIAERLRARELENLALVWHLVGASTYQGRPIEAWYPGDELVDWFGVSLFGQLRGGESAMRDAAAVAFMAAERGKPLMVAEATPRGGIEAGLATWTGWFVPLFAFVEAHDVRLLSYINANWDVQPLWEGQGWGDTRLESNPEVLERWREVVAEPRYQVEASSLR